jgi:hypothetical protein
MNPSQDGNVSRELAAFGTLRTNYVVKQSTVSFNILKNHFRIILTYIMRLSIHSLTAVHCQLAGETSPILLGECT